MQVRARLKNFRMSYKKARLVADLVRGMQTAKAVDQLNNINNKLSEPLAKLINSSISNSVHNFGLDKKNLYIQEIKVDEGQVLKRWRPRAHGRAYKIFKRSCHIELILNEVEEGKGRTKIEKKEVKTVSYKELKKAMDDADKALSKKPGKKNNKSNVQKSDSKKGNVKKDGVVSKMFRRKSI